MLTDALDLSVDQFLESGIVRGVPVVGWVVKLAGIALIIKDRMFAKKLVLFLAGTSTASAEKNANFWTASLSGSGGSEPAKRSCSSSSVTSG